MYSYFGDDDGNVIGIRILSRLDPGEYETILPVIHDRIAQYGEVHLLLEVDALRGVDVDALMSDLKDNLGDIKGIGRVAYVGDSTSLDWYDPLGTPIRTFHSTEERVFTLDRIDEAWKWVREETQAKSLGANASAR
jgi:hypothetical protein